MKMQKMPLGFRIICVNLRKNPLFSAGRAASGAQTMQKPGCTRIRIQSG